jgi:hypothetical protein
MALALQGSLPLPTPSAEVLRRWVASSLSLLVCFAGLTQLVPPALRDSGSPTHGRVSVRVLGTLSTEGLPESARVSLLTVRNDGPTALSWSARPSVSGPGAAGVAIDTWLPGTAGCAVTTRLLTATDWSAAALPPGGSTALCVRVRATGSAAGVATPSVTVDARPA